MKKVRFAYVSSNNTLINVLIGELKLFNISAGEVTQYCSVEDEDTYTIKVTQYGTDKGIMIVKCRLNKCNTILLSPPSTFTILKDKLACPPLGTALVRDIDMSCSYVPVKLRDKTTYLGVPLISGGVYTVFMKTSSGLMYTHDNNSSTILPAQNCEVTVKCFDIVMISGVWNLKSYPLTSMTSKSTASTTSKLVITPLWEKVKLDISGEGVVMSVQDRVSQLTLSTTEEGNRTLVIHKTDYTTYALIGSSTRTELYIATRGCYDKYIDVACEISELGY